jgi:hypothetical protein
MQRACASVGALCCHLAPPGSVERTLPRPAIIVDV